MVRYVMSLVGVLLISILALTDVHAQATAEISGVARDESGAVLPGVELMATQTATGVIRSTVTNETGSYVMPNLALGPWRVEAVLPGFRTFVQSVVLEVNSSVVINPTMQVGQVTETVEVSAQATMVETRNVGIGQVMESQRILELPLDGRNVAELVLLAGAAVSTGITGNRSFPDRLMIASAGGLDYGTEYALDGIIHYDPYDGQALPLPFPDALQEFTVETSGLTASRGRGASVGAVTKSGTNEFHGDLFHFLRNDLFNARNYFATTGSTLKRNQFGGTIGGPIVQNKLFFFGGYQGTIHRQDPANTETRVPTAAMMAGDFTAFASAACNNGTQRNLLPPFSGNTINPAQFSPAALNIANRLPKTDDPCGLIKFSRRTDRDESQAVARADYQRGDQHSIFGRWVYNYSKDINPFDYTPDNLLNATGRGFNNHANAYTAGSTYLINPKVVNSLRLGVSRVSVTRTGAEFFEPKDVGIKAFSYVPKYLIMTINSAFGLGGGTSNPLTTRTTFYQIADDVSLTSGTHQISFGGNVGHTRSNAIANARSTGIFRFDGSITGLGLADFLTGKLFQMEQGTANALYGRRSGASAYVQDTWQFRRGLTLNFGVRWSPIFPIKDFYNGVPNVMTFDENLFRQGIKSTVFPTAPAGMRYHGDSGFPLSKHDLFAMKWGILGPRLGLAWDVEGNGRTSVRASYGLSYQDIPFAERLGEWIAQAPWGNITFVDIPAGGLDDPWRDYPGGNPFPSDLITGAKFPSYGLYGSQVPDVKPTSTQSWNLTLQREVISDTVVSASYLGSLTLHMWAANTLNTPIFFPGNAVNGVCTTQGYTISVASGACSTTGNTNIRRRLNFVNPTEGRLIGALGELAAGGTQTYQGMLLSVRRRAANGVTLNANYTWSHCIGDFSGRRPISFYQDPNNRRADRGNCDSDRRHVLNLTAVAETPQFANPTVRKIATGWRLSGIYRQSSGSNLNITTGQDFARNDIADQRANLVLPDPYGDKSAGPMSFYLSPTAIQQPAVGTRGNLGRNALRGPGQWQFDAALARTFQLGETRRLEFRAEAYHVTNSFRPSNPNTARNNQNFGQIRTAEDPRIMQFALKYVF